MPTLLNLKGVCYLPREVMKQFKLKENMAIKENASIEERKPLLDTVHDFASQCHAQLEAGKKKFADSENRNKAVYALLPAISTQLFLDRLQKHDFDPFLVGHLEPNNTSLQLQISILYATTFKRL